MLVGSIACKAKRIVTAHQVNDIVSNSVHIGSRKDEVAFFIERLRIDSLRITHSDGFLGLEHLRFDTFDESRVDALGDKLKEFYDAEIWDVAPSTQTFMANISMRFYFDADGKLLDYTIKEDTGFR